MNHVDCSTDESKEQHSTPTHPEYKNSHQGETGTSNENGSTELNASTPKRLEGWKKHGTTFVCNICIFLATLEIAIVGTSLVAITDSLKSFDKRSWIITAYLFTYTGFLSIWAKFSDTLGRRQSLSAAMLIFTIASGACGAAKTIEQLIVFRAFQGLGASGIFSVSFVIIAELVEPQKYAQMVAYASVSFVLGFLFGPLFGGAIVINATWRWVFLLNVPVGAVTLVLIILSIPVGFPDITAVERRIRVDKLREIDFLGAFLLFAFTAFLVSTIDEAGINYKWSDPIIIGLLVLACVCAVLFLAWEGFLDYRDGIQQPILTWRLIKNRIFMGAYLTTFFAGVALYVATIQFPQEWQTVHGTSALTAGIRLLPFTIFYAVGTMAAMILSSKLHIPIIFIILLGSCFQIIGAGLISLVPVRSGGGRYVCEILLGIGVGVSVAISVQLIPQLIRGKDQSAAMGAITQSRALGGVIGFAITSNAFNAFVQNRIANLVPPDQLKRLLQSVITGIEGLSPVTRDALRSTFAAAYDLQMQILIGFAVAQALMVILLWEKKFRRLV